MSALSPPATLERYWQASLLPITIAVPISPTLHPLLVKLALSRKETPSQTLLKVLQYAENLLASRSLLPSNWEIPPRDSLSPIIWTTPQINHTSPATCRLTPEIIHAIQDLCSYQHLDPTLWAWAACSNLLEKTLPQSLPTNAPTVNLTCTKLWWNGFLRRATSWTTIQNPYPYTNWVLQQVLLPLQLLTLDDTDSAQWLVCHLPTPLLHSWVIVAKQLGLAPSPLFQSALLRQLPTTKAHLIATSVQIPSS